MLERPKQEGKELRPSETVFRYCPRTAYSGGSFPAKTSICWIFSTPPKKDGNLTMVGCSEKRPTRTVAFHFSPRRFWMPLDNFSRLRECYMPGYLFLVLMALPHCLVVLLPTSSRLQGFGKVSYGGAIMIQIRYQTSVGRDNNVQSYMWRRAEQMENL